MKNHVLVIDDCQMMRSFVSQLLKKNYEVTSCESAEAALTWLDSHESPDLILTDYNLTDMNGLQFIHQVRKKNELEETPIIMLSSVKDSSNRLRVLEAGANDYVTKPFHPRELELRVEQNIENAKQNALLKSMAIESTEAPKEAAVTTQTVADEPKKNTSFLQRFRSAFAS
jgi:DNA-binding response OmpR family regulator